MMYDLSLSEVDDFSRSNIPNGKVLMVRHVGNLIHIRILQDLMNMKRKSS